MRCNDTQNKAGTCDNESVVQHLTVGGGVRRRDIGNGAFIVLPWHDEANLYRAFPWFVSWKFYDTLGLGAEM